MELVLALRKLPKMPNFTKEFTFDLTPKDIAKVFEEMDSFEQAQFFNEVSAMVKKWTSPYAFQAVKIYDLLDFDAKEFINLLSTDYNK